MGGRFLYGSLVCGFYGLEKLLDPESLYSDGNKKVKNSEAAPIVRLNSEAEDTKGALKELIRMIQKKGYHLVPSPN